MHVPEVQRPQARANGAGPSPLYLDTTTGLPHSEPGGIGAQTANMIPGGFAYYDPAHLDHHQPRTALDYQTWVDAYQAQAQAHAHAQAQAHAAQQLYGIQPSPGTTATPAISPYGDAGTYFPGTLHPSAGLGPGARQPRDSLGDVAPHIGSGGGRASAYGGNAAAYASAGGAGGAYYNTQILTAAEQQALYGDPGGARDDGTTTGMLSPATSPVSDPAPGLAPGATPPKAKGAARAKPTRKRQRKAVAAPSDSEDSEGDDIGSRPTTTDPYGGGRLCVSLLPPSILAAR
jgi:hypothetical protein